MQKNKKIAAVLYCVVFGVVIMLLAFLSAIKLSNYYINDITYNNELASLFANKFEADEATCFYGKLEFININGKIHNILGQKEMNGIVKLNNGYLMSPISKTPDSTLKTYAERVGKLNDYLKDKGIPLLYVATPYTTSKYDPQLPKGVEDYANDNADRFLMYLDEYGVDNIDIRKMLYNDGIDQYQMMYKTDHHWNTEAGLYAYSKIEDYLKDRLDCEVDERIRDIHNYTVTNYEEWHLGSCGQRTGIYFAGIDDFHLITPDFETNLQSGKNTGSMQELVYDTSALQNKNYSSRYTYDSVLGKSQGEFVNLNSKNDKKILMVSDSFGNAVDPFLIIGFGQFKYLHNSLSAELTKSYIDEYQPDAVILMYYSTLLKEGSVGFNFKDF